VKLVAEGLHVGELFVALDGVELAAAGGLPAVVDVDVGPAVVAQAFFGHGARGAEDELLAHGVAPAVPAAPAHRGRERDAVADDDAELLRRFTEGVFRAQRHGVLAGGGQAAGDAAGGGVERESRRESVDCEGHRTLAGGRDRVEEWRAGAHAEDAGTVDARRGGGGGREDRG